MCICAGRCKDWGGWGWAGGGGLILSRFFSACLTEAPRQRNRSSHYPLIWENLLALSSNPENLDRAEGPGDWPNMGRRQGAKHRSVWVSSLESCVSCPQGTVTPWYPGNPACFEKKKRLNWSSPSTRCWQGWETLEAAVPLTLREPLSPSQSDMVWQGSQTSPLLHSRQRVQVSWAE